MELTCRQCSSKFRAAVPSPLTAPVRVVCPKCGFQAVLRPKTESGTRESGAGATSPLRAGEVARAPRQRIAAVADEPRPFRAFLGELLRKLGFDVAYFETGEQAIDFIRRSRADLVIVNVYLKGKLGVEVSEDIKNDPSLKDTRVILIGALFRANRFRANPTNLYGADEYIEEQIPEKEFKLIIRKLFPALGPTQEVAVDPPEYEEARRLARLILSDIIIYHVEKVDKAIRNNNFFEVLHDEIEEGRQYYDSRVPLRVRRDTEIYTETLQQFVQMKREELSKTRSGA